MFVFNIFFFRERDLKYSVGRIPVHGIVFCPKCVTFFYYVDLNSCTAAFVVLFFFRPALMVYETTSVESSLRSSSMLHT